MSGSPHSRRAKSRSPTGHQNNISVSETRTSSGILRSYSPQRDRVDVSAKIKANTTKTGKTISEALAKGFELLLDQTMEGPLQQVFVEIDRRFSAMDTRMHDLEDENEGLRKENTKQTEDITVVLKRLSMAMAERDRDYQLHRKQTIQTKVQGILWRMGHNLTARAFNAWQAAHFTKKAQRYKVSRHMTATQKKSVRKEFKAWKNYARRGQGEKQRERLKELEQRLLHAEHAALKTREELAALLEGKQQEVATTVQQHVAEQVHVHVQDHFAEKFDDYFQEHFFETDAGRDLQQLHGALQDETDQRHNEMQQVNTVLKQMADVINDLDTTKAKERRHRIESTMRGTLFRMKNRVLAKCFDELQAYWKRKKIGANYISIMTGRISPKMMAHIVHWWRALARSAKKRRYIVDRKHVERVDLSKQGAFNRWRSLLDDVKHQKLWEPLQKIVDVHQTVHPDTGDTLHQRKRHYRIESYVRSATFRIFKRAMSMAWECWHSVWLRNKRRRNILSRSAARWGHQQTGAAFAAWSDFWLRNKRAKHIIRVCTGRWGQRLISRAFRAWVDKTTRAVELQRHMTFKELQKNLGAQERQDLRAAFESLFSERETIMMAGIDDMRGLLHKIFSTASQQVETSEREERDRSPARGRGGGR